MHERSGSSLSRCCGAVMRSVPSCLGYMLLFEKIIIIYLFIFIFSPPNPPSIPAAIPKLQIKIVAAEARFGLTEVKLCEFWWILMNFDKFLTDSHFPFFSFEISLSCNLCLTTSNSCPLLLHSSFMVASLTATCRYLSPSCRSLTPSSQKLKESDAPLKESVTLSCTSEAVTFITCERCPLALGSLVPRLRASF